MSFFQNFDWSFKNIAKILGAVLLGLVVLVIVISLIGFSLGRIFEAFDDGNRGLSTGDYAPRPYESEKVALSTANIAEISGSEATDQSAENFEVKDYNLQYETSRKNETCGKILDLKKRPEVIFEDTRENEKSCNYRFKVENAQAAEVLNFLKTFNPDDININVYTIQKTIEGFADRLDILKKKLAQTEKALQDAQISYEELSVLATKKQDVESLTKLVDLKLNAIDRLTKERLSINEEIGTVTKSRAEQLNRLKYTNFSVSVQEYLFFDWKKIKDDWKFEVKRLVDNFNDVVQGLSVKLVTYVLRLVEGIIYLLLSLVILKIVWVVGKRLWVGKSKTEATSKK